MKNWTCDQIRSSYKDKLFVYFKAEWNIYKV